MLNTIVAQQPLELSLIISGCSSQSGATSSQELQVGMVTQPCADFLTLISVNSVAIPTCNMYFI